MSPPDELKPIDVREYVIKEQVDISAVGGMTPLRPLP